MKPQKLVLIPLLILAGCASQPPAPVQDRATSPGPARTTTASAPAASGPGYYTVKKGDTLYRIALDHGVYYRDMAAWNNLSDVHNIKEGQVLRVTPPGTGDTGAAPAVQAVPTGAPVETRPVAPPPPVAPASSDGQKREPKVHKEPYSDAAWEKLQKTAETASAKPADTKPAEESRAAAADHAGSGWSWPVTGKVSVAFSEGGNKGIDIAGKDGDAVSAAADGKVFFVGYQKGYGNLLIIGHANGFISVYAHNRKILVTEKQQVSKSQKVAEMGKTDSETGYKLHFEIRQQGKPVDPLIHLPKR